MFPFFLVIKEEILKMDSFLKKKVDILTSKTPDSGILFSCKKAFMLSPLYRTDQEINSTEV